MWIYIFSLIFDLFCPLWKSLISSVLSAKETFLSFDSSPDVLLKTPLLCLPSWKANKCYPIAQSTINIWLQITWCVPPAPVSCSTQQQEIQNRCCCCCCCCCYFDSALAQEPVKQEQLGISNKAILTILRFEICEIVPSQTAQSSDQGSSWEHFRKAFWCFKQFSSSLRCLLFLFLVRYCWSINEVSWCFAVCIRKKASHNTSELKCGHRVLTERRPKRVLTGRCPKLKCWQTGVRNETDPKVSPPTLLYSLLRPLLILLLYYPTLSPPHNMCTCCAAFVLDGITQQSNQACSMSNAHGIERWSLLDW